MAIWLIFTQETTAQELIYRDAVLTAIHDVTIASEAPGIVRKVNVQPGDDVENSEELVKLNHQQFAAELDAAANELRVAQLEFQSDVNLRYAQKTAELNEKLLEKSRLARERFAKSISQSEIDRLELELQQARLSIEQAETAREVAAQTVELRKSLRDIAAIKLKARSIEAPRTGRVVQVFVDEGEWVNAGQPILRMLELRRLRVRAIFDKRHIGDISVGDQARYQILLGDEEMVFDVQISHVASEVAEGVFQVWADIDNPDFTLRPGLTGQLTILPKKP